MGRAQEPGGDYGYDLVHEDVQAAAGRPDRERADTAPQPGRDESSGDYGYDEAHDF
jgi:hypothetical protein